MSATPSNTIPSVDMVARAWHALSDHGYEGVPFDGPGCNCRNYAPLVRQVLELFHGEPDPEPDGLGAVVVNPLLTTDGIWVRAAHPALPWPTSSEPSPQQWTDARENWFEWEDLPRPLVTQSPGWSPPTTSEPRPEVPEPTGLGAVVIDAADETWIRVYDGKHPWFKPDSHAGQVTNWGELQQPVRVQTYGWDPR